MSNDLDQRLGDLGQFRVPDPEPVSGLVRRAARRRRRRRSLAVALVLLVLGAIVVVWPRSSRSGHITVAAPSTGVGARPGWRSVAHAPFSNAVAGVWTGKTVLVAFQAGGFPPAPPGGRPCVSTPVVPCPRSLVFAAFDPRTRGWSRLPDPPARLLEPYRSSTFAWTGQELFVVGLDQAASGDSVPGQMRVMAYEPAQRRWRLLPDPPIRGLIQIHPVWTGHELLLWGGNLVSVPVTAQGAAYDPTGNRWRQLPSGPLPTRTNATTVWTGQEMIIFGGEREPQSNARPDGAAYNPVTNQWRTLAPPPFGFDNSAGNAAAWSGRDFIIWSGYGDRPNDGAAYDPASDRWRLLAPAPIPGRFEMSAVWTGHALFVWGGDSDQDRPTLLADGATYDATANTWHKLPPSPLRARSDAVAVWTGHQALIVDGFVQLTTPILSGTDAATYTP